MKSALRTVAQAKQLSLYELPRNDGAARVFVSSTPETRAICNDPFVTGIRYTRDLSAACARTLAALRDAKVLALAEAESTVLHILRGGLNFGLREALAQAYGWNDHASAFVSAQRARSSSNPQDWVITESAYQKLHFRKVENILFGDVVATGTSLRYALQQIGRTAKSSGSRIRSLTFFTIGGPRSHEILDQIDQEYKSLFADYQGSQVIYIEGIFAVATNDTAMSIKLDGTDLLRTESVLAPEFVESQYDNPAYPLERCTIYDAGSRAFDINEYMHDVREYWAQTAALAKSGMSFQELLAERFPELEASRFKNPVLSDICSKQLSRASQ